MLHSFSDHLPFDKFEKSMALVEASHNLDESAKKRVQTLSNNLLQNAIRSFLHARHETRDLHAVSNSDGYDVSFYKKWNALATVANSLDDKRNYDKGLDLFSKMLFRSLSELPRANGLRSLYDNIVTYFNTGNFTWEALGVSEGCSETGEYLWLEFRNWVPVLGVVRGESEDFRPVAPRLSSRRVQHMTVDFPTGELLVSDWFRFDEFTAKLDMDSMHHQPNISCFAGREARTRHYASNANVVSVYTGNSSPTMLQGDAGVLCAGSSMHDPVDEEKEDMQPEAFTWLDKVSTGLWWVTIVDQQTLIDMLSATCSVEIARQRVEDYIRTNDVQKIKVLPGTHHVYFDTDTQTFSRDFAAENVNMAGVYRPRFIITKDALTLTPTPCSTNSITPN